MIIRLDTLLISWADWAAAHTWKTLLIALLITASAAVGLSMLRVDMTISSILPHAHASRENPKETEDIRFILEEFPAASSITVVIEGENSEALRLAAEAAASEMKNEAYRDIVSGVRLYRYPAEFSESLFYLSAEREDIKTIASIGEPSGIAELLNRQLSEILRSDTLTAGDIRRIRNELGKLQTLLDAVVADADLAKQQAAFDEWIKAVMLPQAYAVNDAETMVLLFVEPMFRADDRLLLKEAVGRIESGLGQFEELYGVTIGLTGPVVLARDEAATGTQGMLFALMLALALIVLLLIFSFRMKSAPLIIFIPLVVGVFWTAGAAGFLFGRLNLMTTMYLVVLPGLGLDFAVHYLTAFLQERETGKAFKASISDSMTVCGKPLAVGALAAAAAFLALLTVESPLVKELAAVAGIGVLCMFFAILILLPGLLSLRDAWIYRFKRKDSIISMRSSASLTGYVGKMVNRMPGVIFLVFSAAALYFLLNSPLNVSDAVEANSMDMEAEGLKSVFLQDRMVERIGMAPDPLYIVSRSLEETRRIVPEIRKVSLVGQVDAAADFLPDPAAQAALREHINQELQNAGVGETSGGSPGSKELEEVFAASTFTPSELRELQLSLGFLIDNLRILARRVGFSGREQLVLRLNSIFSNTTAMMEAYAGLSSLYALFLQEQAEADYLTSGMLPESFRQSYFSQDGSANLITIYPGKNLWIEEHRTALYRELDPITDKATGIVDAADQLIQIARSDGKKVVSAVVAALIIILLLAFRNVKVVVLMLMSTAAACASLLGSMAMLDITFNVVNVLALLLLLGITIFHVVHISRRYLQEGTGSMEPVIKKTGRAMLVTAVVAVIGYASCIPPMMRAVRTTGFVLILVITVSLVFSVFLQGSLLVIAGERLKWSLKPWEVEQREKKMQVR